MANKIYKKLPGILQTDTIKNFFEGTVEQLYSKANIVPLSGFVGKKNSVDKGVDGTWIYEEDVDKEFYGLTPVINNTNPDTELSENFIFYDEFVATLKNYNVDLTDQNRIFKNHYQTFLPPIELNKFLNYQEYYWSTTGPTAISISGTLSAPINVDVDILGKKDYTPTGGKAFRNGMKVTFAGDYVISYNTYVGKEFIVEGVGQSISLVAVDVSYANGIANPQTSKDYVVLGRGSANKNVWSRVNFWYHKENFTDAGDDIPAKTSQADRPILEFNKDLELFNVGKTSRGDVDVSSTLMYSEVIGLDASNVTIDTVTIQTGTKIIFPNESKDISSNVYVATVANTSLSNAISLSTETTLTEGDTIFVSSGSAEIGKEYYYSNKLVESQIKSTLNQAPLFNLYDDKQRYLGDTTIFPNNNFKGNKIFGFEVGTGSLDEKYKLPLTYRAFKNASEISFENFMETTTYNNIVLGSSTSTDIDGYYYYKLLKTDSEYHNNFKTVNDFSEQRVERVTEITRTRYDNFNNELDLGCVPDVRNASTSGRDIIVRKNGNIFTDFSYTRNDDKIIIERQYMAIGDIFETSCHTSNLLERTNNTSRFSLPLAWSKNTSKDEVIKISEPEYLPHFKNYIENQPAFTGEVLGSNNFSDIELYETLATDIVKSNYDLILGAFLLDDQPHNIIDALRFNANEYSKYKKRFFKELTDYYNIVDFENISNEEILEKVLRNLVSFSVGRNVFGNTYILPSGDNYVKETLIINDVTLSSYTLNASTDLEKIENSLLIYYIRNNVKTLMTVGEEYTLTFNPLTVTFKNYSPELLDELEFKIYNTNRDSIECPPTPSTMGLYHLYTPAKITDDSFQTEQEVIVGHDGSRTPTFNDARDEIILEFEKRIFNSAKSEFRNKDSLPDINLLKVRPGEWRSGTMLGDTFYDVLQTNFENWVVENKVDPVVNEFYDNNNKWTWNYRGTTDEPGHWRGWYEYHYDTVRPHTHPWEMLGFTEKPTWWDTQYITTEYSDYGSNNIPMWKDLEKGIIRQGDRENFTDGSYDGIYNLYRRNKDGFRIALLEKLPVDSNANLLAPYDISSTGVSTVKYRWQETQGNTSQGYKTTSFISDDGINVQFTTDHRYITSYNMPTYSRRLIDQTLSVPEQGIFKSTYRIPNNINYNTLGLGNEATTNNTLERYASAVLVGGLPLYSPISNSAYGDWNYNLAYQNRLSRSNGFISNTDTNGQVYSATITSEMSNSSVWGDSTTHSGIVGWAFDGLPIYGPYGYTDESNTSSSITNIKSSFQLKSGTRSSGPGGAHTGEFVQDYEYSPTLYAQPGTADRFNSRYGYTPESPSTKIRYYVVTIDDDGSDMFPYAVGGTMPSAGSLTWQGHTVAELQDLDTNKNGTAPSDATATYARKSELNKTFSDNGLGSNQWRFGDGSPVENAWKYSEKYPFAYVEAVCLVDPGGFATLFSDPTKIIKTKANNKIFVNKDTRKSWMFKDKEHFAIHGDKDLNNNTITNIGYTQFINSWLKFQGLDIIDNFVNKLRNLNVKLGHRF